MGATKSNNMISDAPDWASAMPSLPAQFRPTGMSLAIGTGIVVPVWSDFSAQANPRHAILAQSTTKQTKIPRSMSKGRNELTLPGQAEARYGCSDKQRWYVERRDTRSKSFCVGIFRGLFRGFRLLSVVSDQETPLRRRAPLPHRWCLRACRVLHRWRYPSMPPARRPARRAGLSTSSSIDGISVTRPAHRSAAPPGGTGSGPGVSSRNAATGPVAAHVFETPGTYTVISDSIRRHEHGDDQRQRSPSRSRYGILRHATRSASPTIWDFHRMSVGGVRRSRPRTGSPCGAAWPPEGACCCDAERSGRRRAPAASTSMAHGPSGHSAPGAKPIIRAAANNMYPVTRSLEWWSLQ